jgi:DNA-binding FadR family transcriptional regulator
MARRQVLSRAASDASLREDYQRGLALVLDDHRALFEAVKAGDAAHAAVVMQRHLLATAQDMTLLLGSDGGAAL